MRIVHGTPRMGLGAYIAWRRELMARQRVINRLSSLSGVHRAEGASRFVATFAFDGNSHVLNVMGRPERWQFDLIFDALATRGLIRGAAVDIGAHIGVHSLFFAARYSEVFAFEAHPNTARLLDYNLSVHVPGRARAYPLALSSQPGIARLSLHRPGNLGAFSLHGGHDAFDAVEVPTARLDDIEDLRGVPIGLIKIDTEGAEHDVLLGARETLRRERPVILMEDFVSRSGQPSPAVALLRDLGYDTILEPALDPPRREGPGRSVWRRLCNAFDVARYGHRFVLKDCDFTARRGYDLLLALHRDHGVAGGAGP